MSSSCQVMLAGYNRSNVLFRREDREWENVEYTKKFRLVSCVLLWATNRRSLSLECFMDCIQINLFGKLFFSISRFEEISSNWWYAFKNPILLLLLSLNFSKTKWGNQEIFPLPASKVKHGGRRVAHRSCFIVLHFSMRSCQTLCDINLCSQSKDLFLMLLGFLVRRVFVLIRFFLSSMFTAMVLVKFFWGVRSSTQTSVVLSVLAHLEVRRSRTGTPLSIRNLWFGSQISDDSKVFGFCSEKKLLFTAEADCDCGEPVCHGCQCTVSTYCGSCSKLSTYISCSN